MLLGICLAFVKELYAAGAHILIADLKLHRQCDEWLETIKEAEKSKQRIAFQRTDVTDWKQLEAAFDAFAQKFGGVPDIVCPGAGVYEPVRLNILVIFIINLTCDHIVCS